MNFVQWPAPIAGISVKPEVLVLFIAVPTEMAFFLAIMLPQQYECRRRLSSAPKRQPKQSNNSVHRHRQQAQPANPHPEPVTFRAPPASPPTLREHWFAYFPAQP